MNLSRMRNLLSLTIIFFLSATNLSARSAPDSFADLVEVLIPSVVSIASKTIMKQQYQQPVPRFPEGSPFDEFFKDFFDRNFTGGRPFLAR